MSDSLILQVDCGPSEHEVVLRIKNMSSSKVILDTLFQEAVFESIECGNSKINYQLFDNGPTFYDPHNVRDPYVLESMEEVSFVRKVTGKNIMVNFYGFRKRNHVVQSKPDIEIIEEESVPIFISFGNFPLIECLP